MNPSSTAGPLDPIERGVVDHLFELQPSYAVSLGLHEYDGRLPDLSRPATERWASTADTWLARLAEAIAGDLADDRRIDAFLLRLLLESPLFDLRVSRELERNPMSYVGSVSLTPYLAREYAAAAVRVEAIVRSLEAVPALIAEGRRRLDTTLPKPFVDLALAIGGGLSQHFGEAEAFAERASLGPRVAAARAPAETAVTEFLAWLRSEHLPRASPDFALGHEKYQRLLFVREGIEAPFEEIRAAGAADLERNRSRLEAIARAEGVAVPELFARLHQDHPPATRLIGTAEMYVREARAFTLERSLVSIPTPDSCRVEETPVWGRALSTASLNPPGPFDTSSAEGIYYVTPVDAAWTATQQEEWLRSFNFAMLRNITVHEVYPGHYLQFLHFRAGARSLARKVYLSTSFTEGWAHYCEQLAVEAGLGSGTTAAEVAQLHDALLRDCRLLASVGLHTGGMTLDQATELFRTHAFFEQLPAQREAIRGTFNPEYFCYTLGKLAILSARSKYLKERFGGSLRSFHDTLLGFGSPPIGLLDSLFEAAPTA